MWISLVTTFRGREIFLVFGALHGFAYFLGDGISCCFCAEKF